MIKRNGYQFCTWQPLLHELTGPVPTCHRYVTRPRSLTLALLVWTIHCNGDSSELVSATGTCPNSSRRLTGYSEWVSCLSDSHLTQPISPPEGSKAIDSSPVQLESTTAEGIRRIWKYLFELCFQKKLKYSFSFFSSLATNALYEKNHKVLSEKFKQARIKNKLTWKIATIISIKATKERTITRNLKLNKILRIVTLFFCLK